MNKLCTVVVSVFVLTECMVGNIYDIQRDLDFLKTIVKYIKNSIHPGLKFHKAVQQLLYSFFQSPINFIGIKCNIILCYSTHCPHPLLAFEILH